MQGTNKLIEELNDLLVGELTAIHQYVVHAAMDEKWGLRPLHDEVLKRARMEMKHAGMLIDCILSLSGVPVVGRLNAICLGKDVPTQFEFDRRSEVQAIHSYEMAINARPKSPGTTILVSILREERDHLDWLETQLLLIRQMGLESYLSTQTRR